MSRGNLSSSRARFQTAATLICLALIIRSMTIFVGWNSLGEDTDSYARLAVNLAESGVYGFEGTDGVVTPTAFRPPLYPWLLSFVVVDGAVAKLGAAALNLAMGLCTVGLTLAIGRSGGLRFAWLAACAVVFDPLLLRASQQMMTETLASFLAVLVWWLAMIVWPTDLQLATLPRSCATHRSAWQWLSIVLLGIVLGLAVLSRPTAAPWALLCVLSFLFVGCSCWKRRVCDAILVAAGVTVCVAPWTLRNLQELGRPVWATTHGGYTLLLANNPSLYQHFVHNGPYRNWDAEAFHAAWRSRHRVAAEQLLTDDYWTDANVDPTRPSVNLPSEMPKLDTVEGRGDALSRREWSASEFQDNALAYEAAKATISRHPGVFVESIGIRLAWLWAPWPNTDSMPTVVCLGLWYAIWFLFALVGLVLARRSRHRGWLIPLLLIASLSVVHAIFWSNMRMRAPAMPMVYLLAAASLEKLFHQRDDGHSGGFLGGARK